MKKSWTTLKQIINASQSDKELFLSLIDEKGTIRTANASMLRSLELKDPRAHTINFFDLVPPEHAEYLRRKMEEAAITGSATDIELYVRNGQYHPMKWQLNCLRENGTNNTTFFCLGYKLLDDERQERFYNLVQNHCQLLMEGISGIIFQDTNGELIAANQKLAALFETTLERLYQLKDVAQMWDTAWYITDEAGYRVTYKQTPMYLALQTGQTQRKTMLVQLASGEQRWFLMQAQPLSHVNGTQEERAVATSVIDLTQERQLLHDLQEQEILLHAFLQETPNLAWVVDEDETLLFASKAFLDYFNLPETAIGKKVTSLVPPTISQAVYDFHLEVLDSGRTVQTTQELKLVNGENIISHINLFPVNLPSGRRLIGGQSVSLPDKTHMEKELRSARERVFALSRATSDAIWEWDMQTGQIFRNETLMDMIGYQPDNSRGLSWWLRRVHPDDRNRVSDKVKEATDNMQQSWQDAYRFKCADGSYKYIQDRGFVVYENGLPVKMIGSLQDISALKELEEKLRDERVQRQKETSETMIQVAENERTRIGHELHDNVNQILSTAKLFADMLSPANKDQQMIKDKLADYLVLAIEEIRKLSRDLVAPQLKEESLIDSIRLLTVDLEMAHDMEIRFTHDCEVEQLSPGKKVTLFRIVQEQLKNIIKHSQATVTEIMLQYSSSEVVLEIRDNGTGFEPKQTYRGIGLSNIYERTKFYNGVVDIKAATGKGCTLTVTIPVED